MDKSVKHKKTNVLKHFAAFINKEFYHVFRDKKTLLIMFALPAVQIMLFGFALTNELKNANIMAVNSSSGIASQQITDKIAASKYFTLVTSEPTSRNIETYIRQNKIKAAIIFPDNFGTDINKNHTLQLITDGTDPNISKTINNYISAIIGEYQLETSQFNSKLPYNISVEVSMMYNPDLNGSLLFIPGVIAMIMMIVCTTLTAVSVVREKEYGSLEVLLVSPLKPILVLISKALPYLVLSVINLILILIISRYVLSVPIRGDLALLFTESILFIITCLAFGLLISNIAKSQEIAMLLSMMGMLLPTLLFTGFLFPLENMPVIFQWFANIVPARWFFIIVKNIMLKGLNFSGVWKETTVLGGMAIVLLSISLLKFKKRLQ